MPGNLVEAKKFADAAYFAAVASITREYREDIGKLRNKMAAKGHGLQSGPVTLEVARLTGAEIGKIIDARLEALLEGNKLHDVLLDGQEVSRILEDVRRIRESFVKFAVQAHSGDANLLQLENYGAMVEQHIPVSTNDLVVRIERIRLARATSERGGTTVNNVYHVYGHNPRWNVNSTDSSVNSVIFSNEQIFASLREEIKSRISEGEEQQSILDRVAALEQAQGSTSFAQRYAEFVSTAANHMTLIAPFIPALTEMLQKTLG
jgi:hypothetical protein